MFEILICLLVKHFICDFPLQSHPWLYSRKGFYGAPGGIAHAAIHGVGTLIVLTVLPMFAAAASTATIAAITLQSAVLWAVIDTLIHYHIDWAKMRTNRAMNWKPDNSEKFWILLGFDQFMHHLTYILIAYGVINGVVNGGSG